MGAIAWLKRKLRIGAAAQVRCIDALSTGIPPAAIKASGYIAILGYTKALTKAVCDGYIAAGVGVGTIAESTGNQATAGAAAGTAYGVQQAAILRALGQPPGTLHVVNVGDIPAVPAQIPAIAAYYNAYRAQLIAWQVCGYGTSYIIGQLVALGCLGLWWQNAEDDNGVPGSALNPHANLLQRTAPTLTIPGVPSSQFDEDVVLTPAAINWWGLTAAASPTPLEGEMGLFSVCAQPGTNRIDACWIEANDPLHNVYHGYNVNNDITGVKPGNNMGGWASEVQCRWLTNGDFLIVAVGTGGAMYYRAFAPATGWGAWVPIGITVAQPPAPPAAFNPAALNAEVAAAEAKLTALTTQVAALTPGAIPDAALQAQVTVLAAQVAATRAKLDMAASALEGS